MVPVTAKMNTAERATSAVSIAAPATNGQTQANSQIYLFLELTDLDCPLNVLLPF